MSQSVDDFLATVEKVHQSLGAQFAAVFDSAFYALCTLTNHTSCDYTIGTFRFALCELLAEYAGMDPSTIVTSPTFDESSLDLDLPALRHVVDGPTGATMRTGDRIDILCTSQVPQPDPRAALERVRRNLRWEDREARFADELLAAARRLVARPDRVNADTSMIFFVEDLRCEVENRLWPPSPAAPALAPSRRFRAKAARAPGDARIDLTLARVVAHATADDFLQVLADYWENPEAFRCRGRATLQQGVPMQLALRPR